MTDLLKIKRERWAEEEILSLPLGEHDYFDRKSGNLLSDIKKFEMAVGKALSAFANSGGGHLLLGVNDHGSFDGVPEMQGRTTTREWLEQKIPNLVIYPLQDFRVHQVAPSSPSGIPAGKVLIVIDVGDSELAPHQNASDHIYYCRMAGHSKPAPHFYLQALWQRERYPTGKVVRAWFDSVINPLINILENERKTIGQKKWAWNRFNRTIDGLLFLSTISVNLEQFLLSYSKIRDLLKRHDDAVLFLIDRVSEYHEAIRSSAELKAAYDKATQPEFIRRMVKTFPHNLSESNTNQQNLDSVLGPDEEHFATLSEAIVNERELASPGGGWTPAPFWNMHRETLIDVARGEKFLDYRRKVELAWVELVSAIEVATKCLKETRQRLAIRHGEPYESETSSVVAQSAISGLL
ncbi:MAG: ATP-binding protein [Acidobacteriota bacterium]|nr:MAG: ATP-binding protein [Acidobacteriota bacterium]